MCRTIRLLLLCVLCSGAALSGALGASTWRGVDSFWQKAYVLSFRSPDLLTNEPDERWGRDDRRLVCGGILSDFPGWLREQAPNLEEALQTGRPVLLSLHLHSGYGTGLVSYEEDLQRAEVANYPWLVRTLTQAGLASEQVTVAIDTCNAQATAAHQLRPDLIPAGVGAWPPFASWRRVSPERRKLALGQAYGLFARDRVAEHLARPARGNRARVLGAEYRPLSADERAAFHAHLYGQRGVILATPAFFNLLRLGPQPRGTLTADLLNAHLDGEVLDSMEKRNIAEFRRFQAFGFLASAGTEGREPTGAPGPAPEDHPGTARGVAITPD